MFSHDQLVAVMRALSEPTRMRLMSLLCETELTVSEMMTILGQSQPRVSRHLKLMADAGVLSRNREGTRAFYGLTHRQEVRGIVDALLQALDPNDISHIADRAVLKQIREERARKAEKYFAQNAAHWDKIRSLHISEQEVEACLLEAIGPRNLGALVDIGTGTGRMLQVLDGKFVEALGVDASAEMLAIARANTSGEAIEWRQASLFDLRDLSNKFDSVMLHMVLHFIEDPSSAIVHIAELLRENGKIYLVDFAPHELEFLRNEHNHLRNGFSHHEMQIMADQAGLSVEKAIDLESGNNDGLTVTIWVLKRN